MSNTLPKTLKQWWIMSPQMSSTADCRDTLWWLPEQPLCSSNLFVLFSGRACVLRGFLRSTGDVLAYRVPLSPVLKNNGNRKGQFCSSSFVSIMLRNYQSVLLPERPWLHVCETAVCGVILVSVSKTHIVLRVRVLTGSLVSRTQCLRKGTIFLLPSKVPRSKYINPAAYRRATVATSTALLVQLC